MSLRTFLSSIPKRPLFLHVDINRTIIQTDAVDGKSVEQVLASNVSATTYGTVNKEKKEWALVHGPEEKQRSEELYSYSDFVDEIMFPPPSMEGKTKEERVLDMKHLRKQRQQKYYSFPVAGGLGEQFYWAVEKQHKLLMKPSGKGQWHIIPSFFKLMNALSEADQPFVLFFRTFGTDLPSVLAEWKQFVFGELEYLPQGPILEKMKAEWVEPSIGAIYREEKGMYLTWGVAGGPPLPPPNSTLTGLGYLHSLEKYKSAFKVEDTELMGEMLKEASKAHNVAGFVDYFFHWSAHGERAHAGKLMPTDKKSYHVFFDDNIFLFDPDENSIVDFRNEDGSPMPDTEAAQYAVKVQPFYAIVEEDYFIRNLIDRLAQQAKTRE